MKLAGEVRVESFLSARGSSSSSDRTLDETALGGRFRGWFPRRLPSRTRRCRSRRLSVLATPPRSGTACRKTDDRPSGATAARSSPSPSSSRSSPRTSSRRASTTPRRGATLGTGTASSSSPVYPVSPFFLPWRPRDPESWRSWQPRVLEFDVNGGDVVGELTARRSGYTGLAVTADVP